MNSLSKSEYDVLSLLWSDNRGLTAVEINELVKDKSWVNTSIYLILTSILDKGAVVVDGMVRSGRTYSRLFKAAVTTEEYSLMQIKQNASFAMDKNSSMTNLLAYLIDSEEINMETIEKIEALIKKKKRRYNVDTFIFSCLMSFF